ncbi:MAG: class I SAM-dependent methyltransferase [Proteobacteria bacterium]|nr:class I SAM-dependent methyltransferase [Pseudomonadota bacterium]
MTCTKIPLCPLCGSSAEDYIKDKFRSYFQCTNCYLVFVAPESFLSPHEEKSRYDLHENSPKDVGYRKFLSRICDPITSKLPAGSRGLDFGSGPGPTLSVMFEELGYPMAVYDPFFAVDESVLEIEYDFVTATEVVEHFRNPSQSLDRMWRCVRPGGYLGIMTKLLIDKKAFTTWHYKNDDTHICFFSKETFHWLSKRWQTKPVFLEKDITIFHKTNASGGNRRTFPI